MVVDSAGCAMLPTITSSTTHGSSSTREITSPMAMRHSSSAGTSLRAPHDLQNGVLTPSTMTTPRRGVTGGPATRGGLSFLDLVPGDAVLLKLLVEIAPGRVDRPRGARDVPAVLLELPQDEDPLRLVLVILQRAERRGIGDLERLRGAAPARGRARRRGLGSRNGGRGVPVAPGGRQQRLARQGLDVVRLDRISLDHDQESLDGVAQLAHVASPGAGGQALDRPGGEPLRAVAAVSREGLDEVFDERWNILATLAQGRAHDRHDVEPEEQVLAESAGSDALAEVLVGRGDDARVDTDRLRHADRLDFAVLQHAQDLGLRARAHVSDLVQEDCAAVGLHELADLTRGGAGECPFFVPEQLRLDQILGDGGAVDFDERLLGARALAVDLPGDELLAGA